MSAEAAFVVDDLAFEVRRSDRRRSLQITVDRGGELVLSVPATTTTTTMERFVREKRFWIYTRLAEKELLRRDKPAKAFVSGEGFPYLGRHYRLLLVTGQQTPVRLEAGRLRMNRALASEGEKHLRAWYTSRGLEWLRRRVQVWTSRAGKAPSSIVVQDLGFRWGSCGANDRVNFHWKTILLPPRIIDYVIVHELVHLTEAHHTPVFWTRVERVMPDFAERKQWLLEHATDLVA